MSARMSTRRRTAMHMAHCSLPAHLRAALTPIRPHTSTPACLSPSSLTWRCMSSLSSRFSPQTPGHKALRRPLSPRLARFLPVSRNNSTSHQEQHLPAVQTDNLDHVPHSTSSAGQFAGPSPRDSTSTPQAELTHEAPSQQGLSIYPPTRNPTFILLSHFQRLVPRGLVPQVTAEPPSGVGLEPAWTVTISLRELGIDVKGRGSNFLFAELAAAIQFDLALSNPETVAKLPSWPQARFPPLEAKDIVQSYWQFVHESNGPLKRTTTELDSGAFEARTFAGSTQLGQPVASGFKDSARGIQSLTLAHAIVNGHPDLWPVSLENPFQARIVLDRARLEKLRNLITAATDYLRTTPGQTVGGKQRGAFYKANQEGSEQNTVQGQQGGSEDGPHRDVPDLQSWLAALPFPPAKAKMLVLGASVKCLEHAVLLAAMEQHAVYQVPAIRDEKDDGYRNPSIKNVMEGDHSALLLLFQRLRDEKWIEKKRIGLPKTEDSPERSSQHHDHLQNQAEERVTRDTNDLLDGHKGLQTSPNSFYESPETSSAEKAKVARRFDHFDPVGIASVSTTAREIERSMIAAGLASHQKETSYISVPGSELKIRTIPYGGDLSRTTHKRSILRHLLVLGFPEKIAQIGSGTLAPGQPPQLRINSQEVCIDSPLKAHMPQKQLYKNLKAGPLMVVTGGTSNPKGGHISARYCTPISTWEAVLLGETSSPPGGKDLSVASAVHVLVNNWLPVLVKSEVEGVSNEQARDTLFEAREALHRAIDKAIHDYVKYSWQSVDFYDLLVDLPNEDSFHAKAIPMEKRKTVRHEPKRPRPKVYQPSRKAETVEAVEN